MSVERETSRRHLIRTLILGATAAVAIAPAPAQADPVESLDGGTP